MFLFSAKLPVKKKLLLPNFLLHHLTTTNSFVFDELRVERQQHACRDVVGVERDRVVEMLGGGRVPFRYGGRRVQYLAADRKLDFLGVPLMYRC